MFLKNLKKYLVENMEFFPLYIVSICSYTLQCSLEYPDIKFQTLQDKDMILLIEFIIRGGLSSITGNSYVKVVMIKKSILQMLLIYMVTQWVNY